MYKVYPNDKKLSIFKERLFSVIGVIIILSVPLLSCICMVFLFIFSTKWTCLECGPEALSLWKSIYQLRIYSLIMAILLIAFIRYIQTKINIGLFRIMLIIIYFIIIICVVLMYFYTKYRLEECFAIFSNECRL